jgi:methylated-DNA-[protein]-cysteine S-methyltransferase
MKSIYYYDYPIGKIGIAEEDGCITHVIFDGGEAPAGFEVAKTPLIEKAATQLREYFAGKRTEFDLPLRLDGTPFQRAVWKALQAIPWGETRSYKDIAVQVGNAKATRAVGMANNRNPIPIIVPCHRVVGSDGSLTGYGGGLSVKRHLLELETRCG